MYVLYFHQHFSTPLGAGGTRSYEFARRLVEQGHAVTMVCGKYRGGKSGLETDFEHGRRAGEVDGIRVVEFDLEYSNADGFAKRSATFIRFAALSIGIALRERCDVIFATSTPLTAGIPGIVARWLRGKPFVFEVRDLWPELPRAMGVITNRLALGAMSALEYVTYHSADHVIGLAPGIVQGIEARGIPSSRTSLVPNGCDLDLFGDAKARWRPSGVADGDLMAVFAGTHGVANGLDAVLDAGAELQRRGRSDVKLVLVGDGKLKPKLKRRAAESELKNVIFVDPVSKLRLSELLASADVGLQILANVPAFYDGTSPNKFFDYIATGLPVLINYKGWLAEFVRKNDIGFVVPPDDPTAFAAALETAADNRNSLDEKGARGRLLAESNFSRKDLADQFIAVLRDVAKA